MGKTAHEDFWPYSPMDNWDCIKETTGESETVYHIPEGQILSFIRDGVAYQAHSDALGSIRMITDELGEVVARYEYGAFGEAISVTEDSALADFPNQFCGSLGVRFDATTGLLYMRKRWYSPRLCQFVSQDPIGLRAGANLYRYCYGNPVKFVDPMGLEPSSWIDNNLENVRDAAIKRGIPPEVLCATILTEMRKLPNRLERPAQSAYNTGGIIKRLIEAAAFGGFGSMAEENGDRMAGEFSDAFGLSSGGAPQIKPSANHSKLSLSGAVSEWAKIGFDQAYALDQSARYIDQLHQEVMAARTASTPGPHQSSDESWVRSMSAYNTGDTTSSGGGYGEAYPYGPYSKAIYQRLLLCREKLSKCPVKAK